MGSTITRQDEGGEYCISCKRALKTREADGAVTGRGRRMCNASRLWLAWSARR
ncbi:MAG: hypothetical protein Q6365_002870 [Candidatus Sigynarchaeota archaeon]